MKILKNNNELYEFLIAMAHDFQQSQNNEFAELVTQASRFASGSPSEFLHEAQVVLERIVNERPQSLSQSRLQDVQSVLGQIREAFRKIGGA